jgi:hypothetical protein
VALLLFGTTARAGGITDPVPGHPGMTYETLLREAMPGLKKNDDGTWDSGPLRHFRDLVGKPAQSEDKPPQPLEIAFGSVDTLIVRENGHRRLLVLTDDNSGGTGFDAVLAAFDDEAKVPRFLDYVDAGRDRFNDIGEAMALSGGTDAFLATSSHSNSSQSYEMVTPLFLRGGKFHFLDTLFIYGAGMCSYSMTEDRRFAVRPNQASEYGDVVVRVTIETKSGDTDCSDEPKPPKPGKKIVSDIYRWDARKGAFVAATGAVGRLSDKNWTDATR